MVKSKKGNQINVGKNIGAFLTEQKNKATKIGASDATIVDTDSRSGVGNPTNYQRHRSGLNSQRNSGWIGVGLLAGYGSADCGFRIADCGFKIIKTTYENSI
jgi:hypothetical protein